MSKIHCCLFDCADRRPMTTYWSEVVFRQMLSSRWRTVSRFYHAAKRVSGCCQMPQKMLQGRQHLTSWLCMTVLIVAIKVKIRSTCELIFWECRHYRLAAHQFWLWVWVQFRSDKPWSAKTSEAWLAVWDRSYHGLKTAFEVGKNMFRTCLIDMWTG